MSQTPACAGYMQEQGVNAMVESNSDLTVTQLCRDFSSADGPLHVLRGVDLQVQCGEAVAITGPSGSGKSTLLYIVGTLDRPTSGSLRIQNADPFALSDDALARYRNEHIGFIFQDHHLLPQCTVLENVLIPLLAGTGVGPKDEDRSRELLGRVGLGDRVLHRPGQLSGGERQRVAVCRALINQPLLLLADEPTGNLDRTTAESIGTLLLELCSERNTILICVTHSIELAQRFPRRCQLRDGKVVESS